MTWASHRAAARNIEVFEILFTNTARITRLCIDPLGESFIRLKEVCTNEFRISLSVMDDVFLFLGTIVDIVVSLLLLVHVSFQHRPHMFTYSSKSI